MAVMEKKFPSSYLLFGALYVIIIITATTTTTINATRIYILVTARIFNHRTIYKLFPKGTGKETKYKINIIKNKTVV